MILPITAYTRAGTVGSSSIYCATVADQMVATSQNSVSEYNRHRRVGPAAVIDIDLNRIKYSDVYSR